MPLESVIGCVTGYVIVRGTKLARRGGGHVDDLEYIVIRYLARYYHMPRPTR